jgi:hypothetical protein
MTGSSRTTAVTGRGVWLRRVFWTALLLVHTVSLPSVFYAVASTDMAVRLAAMPRIAGLLLSAAFFVFKIIDVPWLRMRRGWRTAVAAILVVGLLHVGVLDRALGGEVGLDPLHMPWLMLSVVMGAVVLSVQLLRARLTRLFEDISDLLRYHAWRGSVHAHAWIPLPCLERPRYAGCRAPPLFS